MSNPKSTRQRGQNQSKSKKKRSRGRKRQDPRKFWGDGQRLPEPPYEITPTAATDAVVHSLGRPPIPGHESSAVHYFNLVYDRAVGLGFALAAAGGLDQPAPELDAVSDDGPDDIDADDEPDDTDAAEEVLES